MREVPRGGWGNIAAMDAEWGNERGGSRTTNCGLPMPSPLLDFQQAGAQKVAKHHPAASSAAAPPWRHPHACRCPSRPTLWHPSWVEAELVDHVLVTALPHSVHWRARYCCSTNTCMNMSANCATSCAAASGASQGALGLHARDARRNFFGIQQLLRVAGSGL